MVIKYYGFGELPSPTYQEYRNAVLNVLRSTDTQFATSHITNATPSACVWLVPGTFDLEGRHVE